MSRFNHGNNSQRFDLYTFYARIIKGKIVELLDKDGNTPFDSDTIDNSVWDYSAQLYAEMQEVGILPYFDSENFRQDSDGSGNNNFNVISRTQAEAKVFRPLRRFLYSLDSEEGISSDNLITTGFSRNYYSAPMADSDGTIRHVNIYSVLKSHFNRWISYDSFERQKLTSLVIDNLNEDSDVRYRFADNFVKALEEDSDLSRRLVETYSNVLQSDSDEGHSPRQEYIQTIITGLRGLTPGGDSDEAVRLGHVITAVLNNNSDSDSDIRNKYAWRFIKSLRFDSEQADSDLQNRLRDIISNTELTYLESPLTDTRKIIPMDSDDTGSIGDSDTRWALGNFTTTRTDDLKIRSLGGIQGDLQKGIIYVSDSEGLLFTNNGARINPNNGVTRLRRINVINDSRFSGPTRISDLDYEGVVHTGRDSDGRQITNTNVRYNDSDGLILFGKNQMAFDSDKWWSEVLHNIDVFTIDSEDMRDIMRETHVLSENNFPIGQRGFTYHIDSENSNKLASRDLVYVSDKIVDTSRELNRALGDITTKQQIFNTWYRISHQWNNGATPGTFTYPANASEQNSWAYDAVNDVIYTTANTTTFCGFISSDSYDDYTFNSTMNAPYSGIADTNDDDTIASIVGFVTEGIFGQPGYREHTLSFIRVHGGFPMTDQNLGNVQWALVYNYNQDDVRLLVDKTSSAPVSTAPWNTSPNGTRVEIRRKGDLLTAYCSQMNSLTIDSDTEITWDLSSDSDTLKFRGPVRYGYGAHSQQGSYWSSIFFKPDKGDYLHDLHSTIDGSKYTNNQGGNVYEYDIDYAQWIMDSDLTVFNTIGRNRLAHNKDTGKTYVPNTSTNLVNQVMTSRKFSDVMYLPALSSAPDSDMLGNLGLRPGTIARADGVGWDPKSKGGTTPYFVFYNGVAWYEMDTS